MNDSDYTKPSAIRSAISAPTDKDFIGSEKRLDMMYSSATIKNCFELHQSHAIADDIARELAACVEVLHMMLMNQHGYTEQDLADTMVVLNRYDKVMKPSE